MLYTNKIKTENNIFESQIKALKTFKEHLIPEHYRQNTIKVYQSHLQKFLDFYKHFKAENISDEDVKKIQKLLGNKNIQTTKIYTHVSSKAIKGIKNSLDDLGIENET